LIITEDSGIYILTDLLKLSVRFIELAYLHRKGPKR